MAGLVGGFDDNSASSRSKLFRQREDGTFVLEGRYQLDDFFEKFGIDLSEEDEDELGNITTLAGLVFLLLDHMPTEGETVYYKGYRLEVLDMDGNRIDKVVLSTLDNSDNTEVSNID